jgi:SpoVK/Ycf46/Vps4 family AAA+-type ATPase
MADERGLTFMPGNGNEQFAEELRARLEIVDSHIDQTKGPLADALVAHELRNAEMARTGPRIARVLNRLRIHETDQAKELRALYSSMAAAAQRKVAIQGVIEKVQPDAQSDELAQ